MKKQRVIRHNKFYDEKIAISFFTKKRWGDNVVCPYCRGEIIYKVSGLQPYKCRNCKRKFTEKTGTVMERSHLPVHTWLLAMHLIATARNNLSSASLAHELKVQPATARFLMQRIRQLNSKR